MVARPKRPKAKASAAAHHKKMRRRRHKGTTSKVKILTK